MGLRESGLKRRAERALVRQLAYQRHKAGLLADRESEVIARLEQKTAAVRAKIEAVAPISPQARVLEVGCGSMGHIFFFGARDGVGVDPLADHYAGLFPTWHGRARTIAAGGENLPFEDESFDLVLCDNVVDHAESPRRIVEEISRVLAPGGLFYFTVNFHHPFYHVASTAHAAWRALGVPFEIRPFADHTVHLTLPAACALFEGLPLDLLSERDDLADGKRRPTRSAAGAWLQRAFFKNALYERIMRKSE